MKAFRSMFSAAGLPISAAGTDLMIRGKRRLSLYIIGSNLTDRSYIPHLSRLKNIGICSMGRNITLKLIVPWGS